MKSMLARLAMAVPLLSLMMLASVGAALAQIDNALVGAWTIVSVTAGEGDNKTEPYGADVKGTQMFDAGGRFAAVVTRSDLPKVAANNREKATADESQKIVHGSIGYFGSYTVDAANKTMTVRIEGATFPNWVGTSQTRSYAIAGDEMTISATSSSAAAVKIVLKRAGQKTM